MIFFSNRSVLTTTIEKTMQILFIEMWVFIYHMAFLYINFQIKGYFIVK